MVAALAANATTARTKFFPIGDSRAAAGARSELLKRRVDPTVLGVGRTMLKMQIGQEHS
jgi:hypothetical protein